MNADPNWAGFIQILQIIVVPLIGLIGTQLNSVRNKLDAVSRELTSVRERLAHIEGALGVKSREHKGE